jgi:phosphate uptake regulator
MLRQIITLWKGESFIKRVIEGFGEMLSDLEYLYTHVWDAFIGKLVIDEVRQPFYDKDGAVNRHEREIRRMLAEHLSIHPRHDISGCLVMMSLVKDAERIGDYSKNMFEVAVMLEGIAQEMKYFERLSSPQRKIADRFPLLRKAFLESDEHAAKKILKDYTPIKGECNKILSYLLSEELSTREAVATALLSRYLKRINSHMSNIASGIVYPLDQIDFVRGGLLE